MAHLSFHKSIPLELSSTTDGSAGESIPHAIAASNVYADPGTASYDFRSDTLTRPTLSMLSAMATCPLGDEVFHEDTTTSDLEVFIAELTGKEAALLVLSGTMGNQLCLRSLLGQPPHGVLADSRSHIFEWEAGGLASLSGAWPQLVIPASGQHLTLQDVMKHAVIRHDDHKIPTRVISLENTLGGNILPLKDCQEISGWARRQDPPIKMHLDGARLWEAVTALAAASTDENTSCLDQRGQMASLLKGYSECFDTLSLCFSKGLGAPVGSVICASTPNVIHARRVRKSIGGGLRQAGIISAPARVSVEETFFAGKLTRAHEMAKSIKSSWVRHGGRLSKGHEEVETNMVWLDLDVAGVGGEDLVKLAKQNNVRVGETGRIVVHYQISQSSVDRLGAVFRSLLGVHEPRQDESMENTLDGEHRHERAKVEGL